MGGYGIGPTDMPEPLLTAVNCPFNLLQSFKDGVHQSKTDFILVQDMHVCERFRGQKIRQSMFAYIHVAHTAFCVSIGQK